MKVVVDVARAKVSTTLSIRPFEVIRTTILAEVLQKSPSDKTYGGVSYAELVWALLAEATRCPVASCGADWPLTGDPDYRPACNVCRVMSKLEREN